MLVGSHVPVTRAAAKSRNVLNMPVVKGGPLARLPMNQAHEPSFRPLLLLLQQLARLMKPLMSANSGNQVPRQFNPMPNQPQAIKHSTRLYDLLAFFFPHSCRFKCMMSSQR